VVQGGEISAVENSESGSRPPTGNPAHSQWMRVSLPLTILGLLMLCIPPGTVFAWKQLKLVKMLWLPRGRTRLLAAALFWPLIALFGLCQVVFLPMRLMMFGDILATPMAAILTFLFGSILILLTGIWVRRPVPGEFVRMYLERLDESRARGRWSRPLVTWILISVVLILSYPAVVAASLIIRYPPIVGMEAMEGLSSVAVILIPGAYLWLLIRAYRPRWGEVGPMVTGQG
jgi:hypothetical protein